MPWWWTASVGARVPARSGNGLCGALQSGTRKGCCQNLGLAKDCKQRPQAAQGLSCFLGSRPTGSIIQPALLYWPFYSEMKGSSSSTAASGSSAVPPPPYPSARPTLSPRPSRRAPPPPTRPPPPSSSAPSSASGRSKRGQISALNASNQPPKRIRTLRIRRRPLRFLSTALRTHAWSLQHFYLSQRLAPPLTHPLRLSLAQAYHPRRRRPPPPRPSPTTRPRRRSGRATTRCSSCSGVGRASLPLRPSPARAAASRRLPPLPSSSRRSLGPVRAAPTSSRARARASRSGLTALAHRFRHGLSSSPHRRMCRSRRRRSPRPAATAPPPQRLAATTDVPMADAPPPPPQLQLKRSGCVHRLG